MRGYNWLLLRNILQRQPFIYLTSPPHHSHHHPVRLTSSTHKFTVFTKQETGLFTAFILKPKTSPTIRESGNLPASKSFNNLPNDCKWKLRNSSRDLPYHFTPTRMIITKKITIVRMWRNWSPHTLLVEM